MPPRTRPVTRQNDMYEYTHLALGTTRIFDLFISPDWDSQVEGRLLTVEIPTVHDTGMFSALRDFDEAVRYEALSYAWGPSYADGSHLTDSIICDGRWLPVTANLLQALKRLRARNYRELFPEGVSDEVLFGSLAALEDREIKCLESPGMPLWIDAICINQRDNAERSHQVAAMCDIFQAAAKLTAWLGEPEAGEEGKLVLELFSDTTEVPSRAAVLALLRRPWFRRRWVIQEVFARKNYSFLLGDRESSHTKLWERVERFRLDWATLK